MGYERLTPAKRRRFLRAIARGMNNRDAAVHAGVSRRQTLYELAARSPRFAAAWDRAWEEGRVYLNAKCEAENEARKARWAEERERLIEERVAAITARLRSGA